MLSPVSQVMMLSGVFLIFFLNAYVAIADDDYKRVCYGTSDGASHTNNVDRWQTLKRRYGNCTYVDGNLELVGIDFLDTNTSLDFLKDIQEITGYVLIYQNILTHLHLDKLLIIRGENLFENKFALYVALNYDSSGSYDAGGLQQLGFSSLHEITEGGVYIVENGPMCYGDTVNWSDIVSDERAEITINITKLHNCGQCHTNCSTGFCWGDGLEMCQQLSKVPCADRCPGRCYGNEPNECCNSQCAAGCTGPSSMQCLACKRYADDGNCVENCPALLDHTRKNQVIEKPDGKYKYGTQCIKKCPANYVSNKQFGACLAECKNRQYLMNGRCFENSRSNSNRSKVCDWNEEGGLINSKNIEKLSQCTHVYGVLKLSTISFDGDRIKKIPTMEMSELKKYMKNIEVIYGSLVVNGKTGSNKRSSRKWTLDFLPNLKAIHAVTPESVLLNITGTRLTSLDLRSLERIGYGNVVIKGNTDLCFVDTINFTTLVMQTDSRITVEGNKPKEQCEKEGFKCSTLCSERGGCWSPLSCQNCTGFRFDGICVENCQVYPNVYADKESRTCKPCHWQCQNSTSGCDGPESSQCAKCAYFNSSGTCVTQCHLSQFSTGNECFDCHPYCSKPEGCSGAGNGVGNGKCARCTQVRLAEDRITIMECLDPASLSCGIGYKQENCSSLNVCNGNNSYITACVPIPQNKYAVIAIGVVVSGCCLTGLLVLVILFLRRQVLKAEETKLQLTAQIIGVVACEDISPTSMKPDMSQLRLIKESELIRRNIIGSGAFGTVYKGLWKPENEKIRIPVAVKVLQEGTSAISSQELLAEARVMAAVKHPCCAQLLAVCLATQLMLVTQLMPLGSLLDYIRKNQNNIGSKTMLNWCTQIAKGMTYLESLGIIHRDLAARNVLVQSESHVKITDFGLAKLVNKSSHFHSEGEKMPIKWLALESIRSRVYSHKSDVWSFGVTLWEIFTFGKRPYDGIQITEIVQLVEKGERLSQPSICTIDLYMILIRCWLVDAACRPSFSELAEELSRMCQDPGRYLVVPNDSLMRLPSATYDCDSNELLKSLESQLTDNDNEEEKLMLAEDYICQSSCSRIDDDSSISKPLPPLRFTKHNAKSQNCVPRIAQHMSAETRFGSLHQERYSPNPCKIPSSQASVTRKDLSLEPAADENSYLQPQRISSDAYLDLTDNYCSETDVAIVDAGLLAIEKQERLHALDNPEYYGSPQPDQQSGVQLTTCKNV